MIQNRVKELRRVKASDLYANPRNWRTHPQAQQDALRGVLAEIGYADALIARETPEGHLELIDGHLRKETTPDQEVPVLIVDLDQDEANKLLTVLDPLAGLAEANVEALGRLIHDCQTNDAAVQAMLDGLAAENGIELFGETAEDAQDPEPQIDRAAELQKEWGTERGQLWEIPGKAGVHRLLCGDSTKAEDVARVMGGDNADCGVYDPPWDAAPDMAMPRPLLVFADGATVGDSVRMFGSPTWVFTWDCVSSWYTPNRPLRRQKCCLWYGDIDSYKPEGWHYGSAGSPRQVSNSRGSYWFIPDGRGKHLSDIYQQAITTLHSEGPHPHEKPIEWVTLLIANCTTGAVYDPFLGSGTTIIAAEQLGRRCFGIELSPAYCAVILQRCQDAGMRPQLQES